MAATATKTPKPEMIRGTGRRKTSIARVRLCPGTGSILVNDKPYTDYFKNEQDRHDVLLPFKATETLSKYDVVVRVSGGGATGQAGAVVLGVARALSQHNSNLEGPLRAAGLLTRDSRMKERKKYGQRGARRRFQFSKR